MTKAMTRSRKVLIAIPILCAIGLATCLLLPDAFMDVLLRRNPGPFNRQKMEAVVQQVRLMELEPGRDHALRLDDLTKPQSIRLVGPDEPFRRGQNEGNVWARRLSDGHLSVVIETRDLGHAGEYGFAYSDATLSPKPFGGPWLQLDIPGPLIYVLPSMKIDDNWWKVVYNLD
jgi:hypothetical protein